jgi:hypothetical protein
MLTQLQKGAWHGRRLVFLRVATTRSAVAVWDDILGVGTEPTDDRSRDTPTRPANSATPQSPQVAHGRPMAIRLCTAVCPLGCDIPALHGLCGTARQARTYLPIALLMDYDIIAMCRQRASWRRAAVEEHHCSTGEGGETDACDD